MGLGKVQKDEIRVVAHTDLAALGLPSLGPRAADRGHGQRRRRGQGAGVMMQGVGRQHGGLHLLEHIEVVVGRIAVGAQGHIHARLDHGLDVGAAAGELEVGHGVVDTCDVMCAQDAAVLVVQPHAVGSRGPGVEDVVAVEHLGGGQAVALDAALMLRLRLGQVDVHAQAVVDGKFAQRVPQTVV